MISKVRYVIVSFLSILLMISALSFFSADSQALEFVNKEMAPREIVLEPFPGAPEYVHPGGFVSLKLAEGRKIDDISEIKLLSPPDDPEIVPDLVKVSDTEAKFRIPNNATDGVYMIYLKFSDGIECLIPNAVWISTEYRKTLTIGHISDNHLSKSGGDYVANDYFMTNNEGTISALAYLILKGVDVIIDSGDIADSSSDANSYSTWIDFLIFTTLNDIPVYLGKGNHDDPPTMYTRYIAPPEFNVTIDDFEFIFLDSGGDRGYPTMESLQWAEQVLSNAEGKFKVFVIHHPPFTAWQWWQPGSQDPPFYGWVNGSVDEDQWTWTNGTHTETRTWTDFLYVSYAKEGKEEAREFFRLVDEYDVRVVLSGHVHTHRLIIWNGNHYFHTETTTSQMGAHPEDTVNGFNILRFDAEQDTFEMIGAEGMDGMSIIKVPYQLPTIITATEKGMSYVMINDLEDSLSGLLYLPSIYDIVQVDTPETVKDIYKISIGSFNIRFAAIDINISPEEVTYVTLIAEEGVKDQQPPEVSFLFLSPSKPKEGSAVTIYIKVTDDVSGHYYVYGVYEYKGKQYTITFKKSSSEFRANTYTYTFTNCWPEMSITVYAVDPAGHTSEGLNIEIPVRSSIPTPTPTPTPTPEAEVGISTPVIIGIAVVIILVIAIVAFLAVRKK